MNHSGGPPLGLNCERRSDWFHLAGTPTLPRAALEGCVMSPVSPSRSRLRTLLLWAAPLGWIGCGGGGTDVVLPSLSVTTTTTGVELDADGYSLVVDDNPGQPIGPDASLTIERLSDGAHSVALTGLAANCAAAENPRVVTVQSGATANVGFTVTCSATTASIEVSTTTSGSGSDPDGFELLLDGTDRGPIASSTTISLSGLPPGTHTLGLTGLAANCQVVGENPRSLTVAPGQTAQVSFAVTCGTPAPSSGTLEITTSTTGSNPDPDGYSVRVDGGSSQPIGVNATFPVQNVSAAQHSVQVDGVAANCTVAGLNPRPVTVPAGGIARVAFAITCTAPTSGTGTVQITAATTGSSLDPDGYTAAIDNGNPQAIAINGSRTVGNLTAGAHSVRLSGLAANCSVSGDNPRAVTIVAGQTASVSFAVSCVAAGPSTNLRIERMYLIQTIQRPAGDVPLVQGREGLLRVFVTASSGNTPSASVRVRFFTNGASARTETIAAPAGPTPTSVDESRLSNSWNLRVPASLIQPGLSVRAEVDPDNSVRESNENDNAFPASATLQPTAIQAVSSASIRFVPVRQGTNGSTGNVSNSNKDQLMDLARRMYPLRDIQTDVHAVYTTSSGPLDPENDNNSWNQILSEIEALRVAENSDRTYFGVAKLDYSFGIVGVGFIGTTSSGSARAALGWDEPSDVKRVVAHELGHTWGQLHAPCGSPPPLNIDPGFPYPAGNIGVYGYDVNNQTIEPSFSSDIMGYCADPWISDYTYSRVMNFRRAQPASSATAGTVQPSLLIWGHIENGRPVLEPAFQIMARPRLPSAPGPYSLEASAGDGTRIFALSFDAASVADDPRGSRHFAFAVPLDPAQAARLESMRIAAPGGTAAISPSLGRRRPAAVSDSIIARREAGTVALEWNPAAHPMIMVRDPDSGEVLSFGRGGKARVTTSKAEVDLEVSNGLQSYRVRRAISRR